MINFNQWLDHLIYATPIKGFGNRMSMFLISLEAWRRGIDVKFYTIENPENKLLIRYSLSYNGKTIDFNSSLSEQLPKETYEICQNKDLTKKYLTAQGIRVPKGEKITKETSLDYISNLANKLGYPIVMKPVSANAGKGVFSNIIDEQMLVETFNHLTNDLGYDEIIIEEFIKGEEHRLLSVGDKIVGVVKRVPANVVGDGKHTIKQLIRAKNKAKKTNPVIYKKGITIDIELKDQVKENGYNLEDVLEDGKQLFLRTKSNISAGGDPIEVMDEIDNSVLEMGQAATKAIPGIELGGIDMLIDPETNEKAIIEVNTKPMIGLHVFPEKGKPRDVVKDIIDYYFPETKDITRSSLYFDFEKIIDSLDGVATKEIKLNRPPLDPYYAKRFLVSSVNNNNDKDLRAAIRERALADNSYGCALTIGDNLTEVLLANPIQSKVDEFFDTFAQKTEFEITIKEEELWEYPVNVGFNTKKQIGGSIKLTPLNSKEEAEETNKAVIYKKAFLKIEKQNKQLKEDQQKQQKIIENKNAEIKKLKAALNRKWYRRIPRFIKRVVK